MAAGPSPGLRGGPVAAGPDFRPDRRPVPVGAIVVAEAVLVAIVINVAHSMWLGVAVGALLGVVLLVTRPGAARPRHRRRSATGDRRHLGAAALVVADLTVEEVATAAGPVGIGKDDDGWFAVVEAQPPAGMRSDDLGTVDLGALGRMLTDSPMPMSRIQVLCLAQPPPLTGSVCAESYAALLGGATVLAHQTCWVALRLTLETAADELGTVAETQQALAFAANRVARLLARSGRRPVVLDGEALRAALRYAGELGGAGSRPGYGTGARGHGLVERSSDVHLDGTAHACFWVSHWPRRPQAVPLAALGLAAGVPAAVSLIMQPHGDEVALRCLVRIVAAPDALRAAARRLQGGARRLGLRLDRLDGAHALGLYATSPTGGVG